MSQCTMNMRDADRGGAASRRPQCDSPVIHAAAPLATGAVAYHNAHRRQRRPVTLPLVWQPSLPCLRVRTWAACAGAGLSGPGALLPARAPTWEPRHWPCSQLATQGPPPHNHSSRAYRWATYTSAGLRCPRPLPSGRGRPGERAPCPVGHWGSARGCGRGGAHSALRGARPRALTQRTGAATAPRRARHHNMAGWRAPAAQARGRGAGSGQAHAGQKVRVRRLGCVFCRQGCTCC